MPKCWLITGGAISCVAVCLILTSITSEDKKQNDISGGREKRLDDDESYLLRDHGALAQLFYMIYLNCGLLSGEVNSNSTINDLWNLTKETTVRNIMMKNLKTLNRNLDVFSQAIDDSLLMDPVSPNHKVIYHGIDATFQRLAAQSKIHSVKEEVVRLLTDVKLVMDFDWEWADKELEEFSKSKKLENFYSLGPNQTYDEDEITAFMNSYLDRWQNIFQSLSQAHSLWSYLPKRAESLQRLIEQVNNFLEVKIDSIVQAKRQIQIMYSHFETLLPMMLKIISSIGVRDELNFLKGLGAAVAKKKLDPRKVTESIKTFNLLAKKKSHQFLANVLDENLRAMQFGVSPAKKFLEEFDKLGQRFESIRQEEIAVYQVNLVVLSFFNLTVFTKRLEKTLAMTKCMLRAEPDTIGMTLNSVKPEFEQLLKFLSQPQEFTKVLQMEQLFGNIVSNPKQAFADLKNLRDVVLAVKEFTNTMKNQKFSHQAFKVIYFDADLARAAFRKTIKALDELDEPFAGFFEWAELLPVDRWKIVSRYSVSILEVVFWLVVIVGIMILLTKETESRRREKGSEADVFIPTIEPKEFWPQLFQGSRHPLNQLDEDGNTPLFDAVSERNLQEAEQLLEMGASIDVACGPNCQTPLHEAASNDDLEMVKLLLKSGADPKYLNGGGWLAEELCSENSFIPALFSKYFDLRGSYLVPLMRRDFYVLILEPWKFQQEWVAMLPDRLEVVYGYNEGEHNLDDFTHFAVFSGALVTQNLSLNLNKMLAFEILSKPGMIVSLDWLVACLDDPNQVDSDWKFIMTGIQFENKTHYETITKMKRDVHRKRPLLLHGCNFTILPTANRVMQADREAWIRIIEGFGGTYSLCPCPGDPERTPYHNMIQKDGSETLNISIVLYFQDSVLHERWTYPSNNISFFGMGWLVESIFRYSFIPSDHEVLRFETDRESLPVIFEPCAEKIYEGTSED